MRATSSSRRLAGCFLGTLVVTAACVGSSSDALQAPDDVSGEMCGPADRTGLATISIDYITNTSDEEATIVDLELQEPQNLRLDRWVIVDQLAGPGTSEQWAGSPGWRPAPEHRGQGPIPGRGEVQLVLGLALEDPGADHLGQADNVMVTYRMPDGSRGELLTRFRLKVSPGDNAPCS